MLKQEAANKAWLIHALVLPLNDIEKSCYFDSRYQHFFILNLRDFIAFDAVESNGLETSHTRTEKKIVKEKLDRLKRDDSTIIAIPRLTRNERDVLQASFVDQFRGMYHHKQLLKVVSEQSDSISLALDKFFYTDKHLKEIRSYWKEHRERYLTDAILTYAATYNIDLAQVTIWAPSNPITSLQVKDVKQAKNKAWWQLW